MILQTFWTALVLLLPSVLATPYSQYILTPRSRTLRPVSVYNSSGTVQNAASLTQPTGTTVFQGQSAVTYDMGKNVAGIVSFNVTSGSGLIAITFSESNLWINNDASDGTANTGLDEPLFFTVSAGNQYKAAKKYQRGAFRYLNLYHNSTGNVGLTGLSVNFTSLPQLAENQLGSYKGYFHCDDEQLNRVWYAGAYTDELCTIDPTAGNALVHLNGGDQAINTWYNNFTITNGTSALVDGAKRDRIPYAGDMSVAIPSVMVSTYDTSTFKNTLDALLVLQQASGALPYATLPIGTSIFSFTYHLYGLIAISDYYLYTGDLAYLQQSWPAFKRGLDLSVSMVDNTGLAYVTSPADWLRYYMGGHNIEANSILYYTLNLGVSLAKVVNDNTVSNWSTTASTIKTSAQRLWDPSANLYRDNDTQPLTNLHPQDGNCWAIISNITTSSAQNINISNALAARWGPYGAPAPEAGTAVSPFISSFELQAHYIAGQPANAVKLMKFMWGDFMLDHPHMTNSTFIEGYSTDGSLHYPPYVEDARISYAHGWSTGPTSALTLYGAGLQVTSAGGKTWRIAPSLGGLNSIDVGYQTTVGSFSLNATANAANCLNIKCLTAFFTTPDGTSGVVSVENPGRASTLTVHNTQGKYNDVVVQIPAGGTGRVEASNIPGGSYTVSITPKTSSAKQEELRKRSRSGIDTHGGELRLAFT